MSSLFRRALIILLDHTEIEGTWSGFYGDLYIRLKADDGRLLYIPISSILYIEVLEECAERRSARRSGPIFTSASWT